MTSLLSPEVLRKIHREMLNQMKFGGFHFQNTLTNKVFVSKKPLDSLKKTDIRHLHSETSTRDKYLLVRVLEPGFKMVGWYTVVEDDAGNVCRVCVYNYSPVEYFSIGTILIIKEPYLKITNDGIHTIRCDCPSDIIVLNNSHKLYSMTMNAEWKQALPKDFTDPLNKSPVPFKAEQWKQRGNWLFNNQQIPLAREAYLLGLKVCTGNKNPTIFKQLKLNLVAVDLELGYYESVIQMTDEILEKFPGEAKALFRAGCAFYELRKYNDALKMFEKFCKLYPKKKEGLEESKRAKRRLKESLTGDVQLHELYRKMIDNPCKEIDCADYAEPVKIVNIPGKGRGLVLTRSVKKDQILIVSKALAATLNPVKTPRTILSGDNTDDVIEILSKIAQLINHNPKTFGPPVYRLSTGPKPPDEEIPLFCDPETEDEVICDIERIRAICKSNIFAIGNRSQCNQGSGLFILPSYLNHSCLPNVDRSFFNDIMVVQAASNLAAGEELTTYYVSPSYSFHKRRELLADRGFICKCDKCLQQI